MELQKKSVVATGIRLSVNKNDVEIARAYLYIMHNDLHDCPFGLLEDVFVEDNYRGQGIGSELLKEVLEVARKQNCYKLIATSRTSRQKVHELYKRLGFKEYGIEFRIDF
ncbi:GNAT family N-acetyltransferase [Candidatus Gracilibacteria bacterium]|jgi:GNAT superfamily N-acetyltransferase|nr:GNAT family N-acetyltransferase [Candidatus Gracilibacteria bacterium]NJM85954.1 GNAT family N-acetyltransferase [Hydrococcus sp. RU_2_2]NJP17610.1 GNAT family N-acetyltransferase [Hydrococcus sp. CRU_1_1]